MRNCNYCNKEIPKDKAFCEDTDCLHKFMEETKKPCLWCGKQISISKDFCNDKCQGDAMKNLKVKIEKLNSQEIIDKISWLDKKIKKIKEEIEPLNNELELRNRETIK